MPKKSRKTFDLNHLAKKLGKDIVIDGLNVMGKRLNKSIQDNLESGIDVNGKPFKKLKDVTKELGGSQPLRRTKKMGKTRLTQATINDPVYTIEMRGFAGSSDDQGRKRKKGARTLYGALHNQDGGYVTSPKSMIPNKKVPQRKWFGITKEMQPNGKEFKKAIKEIGLRIHAGWRKYGK